MNRLIYVIFFACLGFGIAGCSGTSQTAQKQSTAEQAENQQAPQSPAWFSEEGTKIQGDTLAAYGTAMAANSEEAALRAEDRATLLLKQSISDRLESLRSGAAEELGEGSNLDSPDFLIVFRNAADAVDEITSLTQQETDAIQSGTGMRGFAAVQLSKKQLIDQIDDLLSAHQKSWSAIKNSGSFQNF